ncbi:putative aliphatic sulfonates transport permease protein SsuC [Ensifer psoraleae]|uniref:ABC transporter permease n=1 Tax=Sinorhizobium psoraleae TaxID=520838 RepID=UPI0015684EBB|nr:ABC transporter permease [Sinorhizobium psoraleae]NRP75321.1 putative aliphatic sulfonates transport permease protein SsuC [Sinorhizobium psoraleae]
MTAAIASTRLIRFRRGVTLPILLLIAWEVSSRIGLADPRFLPSLEDVAITAKRELVDHDLIGELAFSLMRNIAGFLIGCVAGVAFASLLALSRTADVLITPTFNGLKQISLLAWIPLISVWFGFGEQAKIAFVALAAFIPIVLNTYEGMRNAPADLVEVGRALRFNARQRILRIFLPAAMPSIATGVHLGLIYSWLATVGAEYFLSVGPGIGGLVIAGRERFDMALVMVGVLILGLVGFLFNRFAYALESYLLRWRPQQE